MENKVIHLNISLHPEKLLIAYDEDGKVEVCGSTVTEVKQKAVEAVQALYGKDCQVRFSYVYVEEAYQTLFEKAITLVLEKHRGQKDKAGKPYYGHVIRVSQDLINPKQKMVGLLHDIIEDTDVTPEFLLQEGFPQEIVDGILSVTRRPNEDYQDFVDRASRNEIGRFVKMADLEDNMNIFRLNEITEEDRLRLNKYLKAWRKLDALLNN